MDQPDQQRERIITPQTHKRGGARPNTGRKPGTSDGGSMLRKTVTLDQTTINKAIELGDGELSEGLRRAVKLASQRP